MVAVTSLVAALSACVVFSSGAQSQSLSVNQVVDIERDSIHLLYDMRRDLKLKECLTQQELDAIEAKEQEIQQRLYKAVTRLEEVLNGFIKDRPVYIKDKDIEARSKTIHGLDDLAKQMSEALAALKKRLCKPAETETPEPPRSRFHAYPTLASATGGFVLPQNQIDISGGLSFWTPSQPYVVGGGTENLGPGKGAFGEIAYHRALTDNLVTWGVVSYDTLGWGPRGDYGSRQSGTVWDNKIVIGWKDNLPIAPAWIYEVYGGLKQINVDQTSRAAGGSQHTGSFVGWGPTVGVTFDTPLSPVSPNGTGGVMFNSYFEASALFGSLDDKTTYGVSGNSSRTVGYTGEFIGLSTKVAPNVTLGAGLTFRQYYGVLDKNLNVGGTSASNNLYTTVGTLKASFSF